MTYWERSHFVKKSWSSLTHPKISSITIITNWISHEELSKLYLLDDKRINVIVNQNNIGSAGAISQWLRHVQNSHDYILLLDDDNIITDNAIDTFFEVRERNACKNKSDALLANRPLRSKRYISEINSWRTTVTKNSYWGFHWRNTFRYAKEVLFPNKLDKWVIEGEVTSAYYWWLFFHSSLIQLIWYPREEFFLYCDDTEFSHRIIQKWWRIIFSKNSSIKDIEESWNTQWNHIFSLLTWAKKRIYFSLRNTISFEKDLFDNIFSFRVNKICFILLILFGSLIYWIKNLETIKKATIAWSSWNFEQTPL